jgi:hypothetical protein
MRNTEMKAMSEAYEATARFYQEKFGVSLNEFSLFQIYDEEKQKLTAFLRANLPSLARQTSRILS